MFAYSFLTGFKIALKYYGVNMPSGVSDPLFSQLNMPMLKNEQLQVCCCLTHKYSFLMVLPIISADTNIFPN